MKEHRMNKLDLENSCGIALISIPFLAPVYISLFFLPVLFLFTFLEKQSFYLMYFMSMIPILIIYICFLIHGFYKDYEKGYYHKKDYLKLIYYYIFLHVAFFSFAFAFCFKDILSK